MCCLYGFDHRTLVEAAPIAATAEDPFADPVDADASATTVPLTIITGFLGAGKSTLIK